MGSGLGRVKLETIKLVFAGGIKTYEQKNGMFVITIMCSSGATCLSADCCFDELAL